MLSSRPVQLQTEGRLAAKTPGRENATHRGAMTVHGKGKSDATVPLHPATLQNRKGAKDIISSKLSTRVVTGPLVDKTPFPNRDPPNEFNTPLPGDQKLAKLVFADSKPLVSDLLHPSSTPDSVARPSSTRKHVRAPHASRNFETPPINGNPWDVSEHDIVVEEPTSTPAPEVDDYDEIEYMPPKPMETPYMPPFDLPNYSSVGATLLNLACSYPYDDTPPVEIKLAVEVCAWDMFSLPALESDDPFIAKSGRPVPSTRSKPTSTSRPGTSASKPLARPVSRSAASTTAASGARVRPATVTAMYPTKRTPVPSREAIARSATNSTAVSGSKVSQAASKRTAPMVVDVSLDDSVGEDFMFDV
ncbi:hypothetical protein B0H10DRAFT_2036478 [Mycena sp. CBHHK59/15]|nr:hypothetical protein B0H10DRAFT_2036478 [Mycena sp. CBHHK59/15]